MGLWLEFRCEGRGANPECLSNRNSGPMGMFGDDLTSVRRALKSLRADGEAAGWRRNRDGWQCPRCRRNHSKTEETGGSDAPA